MSRKFYLLAVIATVTFVVNLYENRVEVPLETTNSTADVYKVTAVIDGDTIKINKDGKEETLRLIGIDTPETDPIYNKVECYSKEATTETISKLLNKTVQIEQDKSQASRDKFDRLLVYVFIDGQNFNEHLIRQGFAKEYTYAGAYKYQKEFRAAESIARDGAFGLWSEENCPR
jgi:micrococcal nuclease